VSIQTRILHIEKPTQYGIRAVGENADERFARSKRDQCTETVRLHRSVCTFRCCLGRRRAELTPKMVVGTIPSTAPHSPHLPRRPTCASSFLNNIVSWPISRGAGRRRVAYLLRVEVHISDARCDSVMHDLLCLLLLHNVRSVVPATPTNLRRNRFSEGSFWVPGPGTLWGSGCSSVCTTSSVALLPPTIPFARSNEDRRPMNAV